MDPVSDTGPSLGAEENSVGPPTGQTAAIERRAGLMHAKESLLYALPLQLHTLDPQLACHICGNCGTCCQYVIYATGPAVTTQ